MPDRCYGLFLTVLWAHSEQFLWSDSTVLMDGGDSYLRVLSLQAGLLGLQQCLAECQEYQDPKFLWRTLDWNNMISFIKFTC